MIHEPRWFPSGPHGYLVAERDVPELLRGEITHVYLVRNPIAGASGRERDRVVLESLGRGTFEPSYWCSCGGEYCGHRLAVKAFSGGPTWPPEKPRAAFVTPEGKAA